MVREIHSIFVLAQGSMYELTYVIHVKSLHAKLLFLLLSSNKPLKNCLKSC